MKILPDRLIEIIRTAQGMPVERRREYLVQQCQDDSQLLDFICKLMALMPPSDGLPESQADLSNDGLSDLPAPSTSPSPSDFGIQFEGPGSVIGHYNLIKQIGEGGFGTVFEAEQIEPVRRRVALKIIKIGMDTREVIGRFNLERQALAMMEHPHIAKVFDAGATATGRPYFVMELVRGTPINQHCDQQRLGIEERVQLFVKVCQAVQHAHQKGIIHRDIKPSNILVTLDETGADPKIIDFGIAKAMKAHTGGKTQFTSGDQIIGTREYMSPEQAKLDALNIDTVSDIYSLGVVFYELLTGRLPIDPADYTKEGMDAFRKAVRELDPPRPSACLRKLESDRQTRIAGRRGIDGIRLIRLIRGDLDWIVMKCLEKSPSRRYQTANGLAADLVRFLDDEVVKARPPSLRYQATKFVRRNRAAVVLASVVSISAFISLLLWWSGERARDEKAFAKMARQEVYAALISTIDDSAKKYSANPTNTFYNNLFLDMGLRIAQKMTNSPDLQVQALVTVAKACRDLKSYPASRAIFENALAILDRGADITLPTKTRMYIEFSKLCEIEKRKEALDYATRATNLFVGCSEEVIAEYADALGHLAGVERGARCFDSAKSNQLRVIEIRARHHDDLNLAVALCDLGTILMENADFPGATNAYSNAMVRFGNLDRRYPLHELFCLRQWASFLLRQGKCEDATNQFGNMLVRCRNAEPEIDLKSDVNNLRIDSYIALAKASVVMGTLEDAEKYQVKAIETYKITLKNADDQKAANNYLSFIRALNDNRETDRENDTRPSEWEENREQFNKDIGNLHCAHCLQIALDELEKPLAKSDNPLEQCQSRIDKVANRLWPTWATNIQASLLRTELIDALKHNPKFLPGGGLTDQGGGTHPVIQCAKHHLEILSNHSVRRMDPSKQMTISSPIPPR